MGRFSPYMTVVQDEAVVLVATDATDYGRKLAERGITSDTVALDRAVGVLRERGLSGSTFVDVGAHIGTTTLRAALHHGFPHVVAFEPDPDNARLLRANVALNGLHRSVDVVEAAVGHAPGTAPFARGGRTPSGRRTGKGSLVQGSTESETVDVELTTLDHWLAAHAFPPAEVALLWIDAQGNEPFVLDGAGSLLAEAAPMVLAFRPGRLRTRPRDWLAHLRAAGYDGTVDLRHPSLYRPGWEPRIGPIGELEPLLEGDRATDVLVFATAAHPSSASRVA